MANKNLNDYVQKGQYGIQQTLPEERKKFLGSLRERVYLTASLEQIASSHGQQAFAKEFKSHSNGTLLLNGTYEMSSFSQLIQISQQAGIPFTMVANETAATSPYAAIYTATTAVNESVIDLNEKYPLPQSNETQQPKKKKSFFKRFFS